MAKANFEVDDPVRFDMWPNKHFVVTEVSEKDGQFVYNVSEVGGVNSVLEAYHVNEGRLTHEADAASGFISVTSGVGQRVGVTPILHARRGGD